MIVKARFNIQEKGLKPAKSRKNETSSLSTEAESQPEVSTANRQ